VDIRRASTPTTGTHVIFIFIDRNSGAERQLRTLHPSGFVWGEGYDVKDWATCIATAPELTHREDSECSCGDEKEEEEKSHCSANGTSGRFNNRRRKSREV
jgi:hypothetical protein